MSLDESDGMVMDLSESGIYASTFRGGAYRAASGAKMMFKGHPMVAATFRLADATAVTIVASAIALLIGIEDPSQARGLAFVGLMVVLPFFLLPRMVAGPGQVGSGPLRAHIGYLREVAPALLCSTVLGAAALAYFGWHWPMLAAIALGWTAVNAVALLLARAAGYVTLAHPRVNPHVARKVAVVGSDVHAWRVASFCQRQGSAQIRLLGIFDDGAQVSEDGSATGSIEELVALSRDVPLDDIIIAIPPREDASEQVQALRWRLRGVATEIYVLPYLARREDALPIERLGPFDLAVVQRRPLSHGQAMRKRLFDLFCGLAILLMLLPVLAVVALAVKLDSPGPILFRQPRLGLNDRTFTILKFRSMYANASDLMSARQTSREDARVTRVGKWLRRLSLDELPQIFNVLAGDMSLVGPRPHAPHTRAGGHLLKDVMAEYVVRHQVKPGITGWAQINGSRGELVTTEDLRRRVTYDLEYIKQWSLWLDMKIIVLTVLREVFSKHAF